jgi:predicted  nucleic acid-binding Zn-ribbon protein
MKYDADELLDQLEELEATTKSIDQNVSQVKQNQDTLQKYAGEGVMEAAVLMLEASKLANDSAASSQSSAEANLKMAKQQQMQIDEMHEVITSWRQSIRSANQELKSSRSFFLGLFFTGLTTTLLTAGGIGWWTYQSSERETQLKTELQDLIRIESALSQRQINLKIDELASIIEVHTARQTAEMPQTYAVKEPQATPPLVQLDQEIESSASIDTPEALQPETAHILPKVGVDPDLFTAFEQGLNQLKAELNRALQNPGKPIDLTALTQQLNRIEALIRQQTTDIGKLSLLVSAQTNKASTSPKPGTSQKGFDELSSQMQLLQTQLKSLEQRQQEMGDQIKVISEKYQKEAEEAAKSPQPYSYRSPYEFKQ